MTIQLRPYLLLAATLLLLCTALCTGCKSRQASQPDEAGLEAREAAPAAPEWLLGTWRVDVRASLEYADLDPEQLLLGMILGATTRVTLTFDEDGSYASESRAGHSVRRRSGSWRMLELLDDGTAHYEVTLDGQEPERLRATQMDDGAVMVTRDDDTLVLRRPHTRGAADAAGDNDDNDDNDGTPAPADADTAAELPADTDAPGDNDGTPALADPGAEQ